MRPMDHFVVVGFMFVIVILLSIRPFHSSYNCGVVALIPVHVDITSVFVFNTSICMA